MTNFAITITSDPVCPWCYIAKKRLDATIALYNKVYPNGRADTFTLTWRAFYLDRGAPTEKGIPWEERLLQKLASTRLGSTNTTAADATDADVALAKQLRARLADIGRMNGITFSFAGRIGSTRAAHRAIAFSRRATPAPAPAPALTCSEPPPKQETQAQAQQNRFMTSLFAAHFEGTLDITSHGELADVAFAAGLHRAEMLAYLDSGAGGDEVDAEDRESREVGGGGGGGIRGVPYLTVQGIPLDGAPDVQDLLELFVKVKEEEGKGYTQEKKG